MKVIVEWATISVSDCSIVKWATISVYDNDSKVGNHFCIRFINSELETISVYESDSKVVNHFCIRLIVNGQPFLLVIGIVVEQPFLCV